MDVHVSMVDAYASLVDVALVLTKALLTTLFFLTVISMWAVEAQELRKSFGDVQALRGVSFSVSSAEVFGLLGPNGAGKTTTVRILTCVLKPDSGSARVLGYDVVEQPERVKKQIGVVPEEANAYPDLSAWRNLVYFAQLYGLSKREAERRAVALLKEFGLYERRDSLIRAFSKGMRQRLMLCMALISDPILLFLDEPTSGLDVQSARMIRQKILEAREDGKTVLLTMHNMFEAEQLCEKIAIINKGKIVEVDTLQGLREKVGDYRVVEFAFDKEPGAMPLEAEKVGEKYRVITRDPHSFLCEVVDFARDSGLRIADLTVRPPSLEEVFVKLTES